MSGIMAIVSLDGRPVPGDLARAQLDAIAHRGEWEPKLWEAPGIALGHVNLPRTPEAEREVLPTSDPSERYWITWDGRLDNRAELAGLLQLDPERARQMTDADYVLAAFEKWSDDCVKHLVGDWAVVIWDSTQRKLFCAKDPLGWRQLYYAKQQGLLFVGSEPQQLFAGGQVPAIVNNEYLLRFLAGALQEPGSTHWEGLLELGGGQHLEIQDGQQRNATYWNGPQRKVRFRRPEDYVDQFEHLVAQATTAQTRTNKKLASFLSGGLDSSYVTSIASRMTNLEAYTMYVPGSRFLDEREYARLVAERARIVLHEVDTTECWYLSSKWLPLDKIDQPFVPGAGTSLLAVVDSAKQSGVGVMLGGEGGDEWLSGGAWSTGDDQIFTEALFSFRWRTAKHLLDYTYSSRNLAAKAVAALAKSLLPTSWVNRLSGSRTYIRNPFPAYVARNENWTPADSVTQMSYWQRAGQASAMLQLYRNTASREAAWRDRHGFLGNGVEIRCPLNDKRVVEFLFSTPDWVKRYNGLPRDILRAALCRSGLPEIAARRDKAFFAEQMRAGLAERELQRARTGFDSLRQVRGFDGNAASDEFERWLSRHHGWGMPLYNTATTGLWLQRVSGDAPLRGSCAPMNLSRRKEVLQMRKTYSAPELSRRGALRDTTQGGPGQPQGDFWTNNGGRLVNGVNPTQPGGSS